MPERSSGLPSFWIGRGVGCGERWPVMCHAGCRMGAHGRRSGNCGLRSERKVYQKSLVPFRADFPRTKLQEVRFGERGEEGTVWSPYPNFVPGLQGIHRTTMFIGRVGTSAMPRSIVVSGRREPFIRKHGGRRLLAIGLDGSVEEDFIGPLLPVGTLESEVFLSHWIQMAKGSGWRAFISEKLRRNTHQVYQAAWSDREFRPVWGEEGVIGEDMTHLNQPRGVAFNVQWARKAFDLRRDE